MTSEFGFTLSFLLAIALVSGWLAGLVTRGNGFGFAGNSLVALAGAWGAAYLDETLRLLPFTGLPALAFAGFCGAFALLAIVGAARR